MITITGETTVGEVARVFPAAIPVFQQYGIDFCCGGQKPLQEACQEKGVPLQEVLDGVEKTERPVESAATDWNSAELSDLIDHILARHHAYLWKELPRLADMVAKVIKVHGGRHADSLIPLGKVYTGLQRELELHMTKEENILFPLIVQMERAQATGERIAGMPIGGPIGVMEMEHESAGTALREMREITSGYQVPQDACTTYAALFQGLKTLEEDLHEHIHLENNILFPRALEI